MSLAKRVFEALSGPGELTLPGFGRFFLFGERRMPAFRPDRALMKAINEGQPLPPLADPELMRIATQLVAKAARVEVPGLGVFTLSHRREFTGINPATGQPMQVPALSLPSFRAERGLREAMRPKKPGPWDVPGTLCLDRHSDLVAVIRASSEPAADLEAAIADPRWSGIHTLAIRGAHDGDAHTLARADRSGLRHVRLELGGLGPAGARALAALDWPALQDLQLDETHVDAEGIEALRVLPGFDPGRQGLPLDAGLAHPFAEEFAVSWEDLDPLVSRWVRRLLGELQPTVERLGLDAAPLAAARRRRKPETLWRDARDAVAKLRTEDLAGGRLIALCAHALDRVVRGGLEGDFGNDFGWAVDLAEAVPLAAGTREHWVEAGIAAVLPSLSELHRVREEIDGLAR